MECLEPFYASKNVGLSGTGLGMALVYAIVKDHHGFIDVKSVQGTGTTFTLYLPLGVVVPDIEEASEGVEQTGPSTRQSSRSSV